nr:L-rhamnose mutarotase [Curtobacterium pusillum]
MRAGSEAEYERVHASIPPALAERLRAAGVTNWSIWRDGQDLFHLIEVDDYRAMRRSLADDPVNVAWQEIVNPLLEADDDYSGDDEGIPLVWTLEGQS